jgi:hypothetical protein
MSPSGSTARAVEDATGSFSAHEHIYTKLPAIGLS